MNSHPTNGSWQVRLFGRFSLTNPGGELVRLPDRKTEGLLAILALNRDLGISRREAANILWPDREPTNLTNFRQAIAVLRRVLGADAIEGSNAHCRLASSFCLVSDFESPDLRGEGGFMPGHDGEWFSDFRIESLEPPISVVDHYFQSLQWFAAYDPRNMYAILGATPSMARSLPFREFGGLLEKTKSCNPPAGWHAFWTGTVKPDLAECKDILRFSLREARREGDLALASEVCLEFRRAYSRLSEHDRAMRICDIADGVADQSRTREARRNALRLRGTIQFQWHEPEAGDATLRTLEADLESPLELASVMNLRAFFEASSGWYERAAITHKGALQVAHDCGHFRIGILSATTAAMLEAAAGRRTVAIRQLEALAAKFYADDTAQFGVYAQELVAKLHLLEGDKVTARRVWESARLERARNRMSIIPIEARRVAAVR